MNVLIIDDEKSQEELFKDANEYIYENKFKLSFAKNIEEACKIILMKKFEVIIVDLDLSKQTKDFLGNELIKIVLEKVKCFLIVYSGNIEKLDEGLIQNFKNSPFFMKINKGVEIPGDVLGIIKEREYLFPIIKDDTIENSINEIFWNGYNEIYQVEIEKKYRDDKEKEEEILAKIEVCQTEFDEERKRLEEIEIKILKDYLEKGVEKEKIINFPEGKKLLKENGVLGKRVDTLDKTLQNLKDEIGKVKQKREKRERGLSDYKAILLEHSIIESYNQKEEKIEGSLMYISKGLCKSITTGTVLNIDNEYYFVITPSCDIAQGTTSKRHLIKCKKISEYAKEKYSQLDKDVEIKIRESKKSTTEEEIQEKIQERLNDKRKNFEKKMQEEPKNGGTSIYILPKGAYFSEHKVIDFHDLKIIDKEEASIDKIHCQVTPRISQEIISKFSNCYGRQGSPDYSVN